MSARLKICVLLSVIFSMVCAAETTIKWDCGNPPPAKFKIGNKSVIRNIGDKKYLISESNYDFARFFTNLAANESFKFTVSGTAVEDGKKSSIGAIAFKYENKKWNQVRNLGWKKVLPYGKNAVVNFEMPAKNVREGRYMVIFYRTGGKVAIQDITFTKNPASDK